MTTETQLEAPPADDVDLVALGALLVQTSTRPRDRIAAQALADERTILALPRVQESLIREKDGRRVAHWEGLMGKLYTLPLDAQQRAFLGLVLSMVGIGLTPLSAVDGLDTERLRHFTQAVLRLAGDDSIAIATRI